MTRSAHEFELVRFYVDWGLNNCEIERLTGIPRTTIREWRHRAEAGLTNSSLQRTPRETTCPICSRAEINERSYAYLLGLYLGDGCLSEHPRNVFKLRIVLDERYLNIIGESIEAIETVVEDLHVGVSQRQGCLEINSYWKHWPCLFPQHAPGRKHEREIQLDAWQQRIIDRHPDALLRGLIHSDGWRGTNHVLRTVARYQNSYSYPRYQFTNESADIKRIFCEACDRLDVSWRRMNRKTISVARRADVEKLDLVIGPKT